MKFCHNTPPFIEPSGEKLDDHGDPDYEGDELDIKKDHKNGMVEHFHV
jgi:hypothetical protein